MSTKVSWNDGDSAEISMLISLMGHSNDSGDKGLDSGEEEFDSGWNIWSGSITGSTCFQMRGRMYNMNQMLHLKAFGKFQN